ncbi:MAG: hypothetical protein R2932_05590 [Caldilineaceae bacterium]
MHAQLAQLIATDHVADALQMALLAVAGLDLTAYNRSVTAVSQAGLRILQLLTDVLGGYVPAVDKLISNQENSAPACRLLPNCNKHGRPTLMGLRA